MTKTSAVSIAAAQLSVGRSLPGRFRALAASECAANGRDAWATSHQPVDLFCPPLACLVVSFSETGMTRWWSRAGWPRRAERLG